MPISARPAVTCMAVLAALSMSATAALAASGTINTAGAPLTVRSGPGTGYSAVGTVADGTAVTISCQTVGSSVTGTYGTSSIWDKIGEGRYVSDAYTYTGSDSYVAPACGGSTPTTHIGDNYPYHGATGGVDPWNFYKGQCTSFAAWRVTRTLGLAFHNYYKGQHWGNANHWDDAARAAGISVTTTPRVGDIAVRNSGTWGHVAYVEKVNADGSFVVEDDDQKLVVEQGQALFVGADEHVDVSGHGKMFIAASGA